MAKKIKGSSTADYDVHAGDERIPKGQNAEFGRANTSGKSKYYTQDPVGWEKKWGAPSDDPGGYIEDAQGTRAPDYSTRKPTNPNRGEKLKRGGPVGGKKSAKRMDRKCA